MTHACPCTAHRAPWHTARQRSPATGGWAAPGPPPSTPHLELRQLARGANSGGLVWRRVHQQAAVAAGGPRLALRQRQLGLGQQALGAAHELALRLRLQQVRRHGAGGQPRQRAAAEPRARVALAHRLAHPGGQAAAAVRLRGGIARRVVGRDDEVEVQVVAAGGRAGGRAGGWVAGGLALAGWSRVPAACGTSSHQGRAGSA